MDAFSSELRLHFDEPIEPSPVPQARLRSARRLLRRKERRERGLFLAEGPQAVREALAAGAVAEIFVSRTGLESGVVQTVGLHSVGSHSDGPDSDRPDSIGAELTAVDASQHQPPPLWWLADDQFADLSDTVTPQGIVAVCRRIDVDLDGVVGDASATPRLVVCCAEIRDPGNAGTIIRSADAAGADAVVLGSASVDLYNPKTVRASTGSIFHLPIMIEAELPAAIEAFRSRGLQIFAAAADAHCDLDDLAGSGELARPTLWLLGNEAHGLDQDQLQLADRTVSVPIYGRAESLNLSTAAAVCLYASASAQNR